MSTVGLPKLVMVSSGYLACWTIEHCSWVVDRASMQV